MQNLHSYTKCFANPAQDEVSSELLKGEQNCNYFRAIFPRRDERIRKRSAILFQFDITTCCVPNPFYYTDTSLLLKNTPLVKFIRNYIRDPRVIFSISSVVRMLRRHFPLFTVVCANIQFVFIIKRKLHGSLKT